MGQTSFCGICGCALAEGVVRCERCETPHHQDCWDYNQGCAVFACNPATKATPVKGKGSPAGIRWLIAAGLSGLALAVALGVYRTNSVGTLITAATTPVRAGAGPVGTEVGMIAPDFRVQDIDGNLVRFHELRRGKLTVLTFWLAYCHDCMPHVPKWTELYQRYQDSDQLSLVNVAAFTHDSPRIREYLEKFSIGGRVLMDGTGEAVRTYGVGTITVFVLDRDGRIVYVGAQAKAAADEVQKVLTRLGMGPNAR